MWISHKMNFLKVKNQNFFKNFLLLEVFVLQKIAAQALGGWNFEEIQFLNRRVMRRNFQGASFGNLDFPQDGLFGSQNERFWLELKVLECSGFSNDEARLQKLQYRTHWNRLFLSFQELLPGMSYRSSKKSYGQNTEAKKFSKFFEKIFLPKNVLDSHLVKMGSDILNIDTIETVFF